MKNCVNCGANNFKVVDNYFICTYCNSVVVPLYDSSKDVVTVEDLRTAISLQKKKENKKEDHNTICRGGIRL